MEAKEHPISVIIPIYNVEDYLEEAILSVTSQTVGFEDNIQLILVNDGSLDNSYQICKKYSDTYPDNVVYVEKTNGGLASARNAGFKCATGKYVMFLDGDDFFEKDLLKTMVSRIEETQSDIALCRFKRYNVKTKQSGEPEGLNLDLLKGETVFNRKSFPDNYMDITYPNVWTKMFRREFLVNEDISFKPLRNAEDMPFTYFAMSVAERICYVEDALINYRVSVDDQLSSIAADPSVFIDAEMYLYEDLQKKGIYEEVERTNINRAVNGCLYYLWRLKNDTYKQTKLKLILAYDFMPLLGLLDHPKDYYFDYAKVGQLISMRNNIQKERQAFDDIISRPYIEQNKRLDEKNRRLDERNKRLDEKRKRLYAENKSLEEDNKNLKGKVRHYKKKYKTIRDSFSFKIGRIITWIPRKIRHAIKGIACRKNGSKS